MCTWCDFFIKMIEKNIAIVAVKTSNLECVQLLTAAGAKVNCQMYCGTSPLHQAVSDDMLPIVRHLLDSGARLDLREEYDITPIFTAAHYGKHQSLKLLLEHARAQSK